MRHVKEANAIVGLLMVGTLLFGGAPTAAGALPMELLENGGFEEGTTGWSVWGDAAACRGEVSTSWSSEGQRSYYLEDQSSSASCGIYQSVPVQAGCAYLLRATLNVVETPPAGSPQVYLRWVDAGGNDVGEFPYTTATETGVQIHVLEGTAPAGATHVRVWFYVPTEHKAKAFGDDFSLVGLPTLSCPV